MWKFLLAWHQQGHRRSSQPLWSLHLVPESECCSTPHTYTYTIVHPWQMCATDIFTLEGIDHLVVGDFYSKDDLSLMPSTWPEQCEQGHLTTEGDVFRTGHPWSPLLWQWPSVCKCPVCRLLYILGHITHETSSLHYPQSNGFTEACIKSIKHALQWDKYSGANPHLALLALHATPIDTKLPSPAELLYQCWLRTTIPAKICNSDPSATHIYEQIDTHSESAKAQADKCSKTLVPLYAGQPVATYNTLPKDLGSCYCDTHPTMEQLSNMHQQWFHIPLCAEIPPCEWSVKAADTVPSGTTATLQALTRHHLLVAQPASLPQPATHMQSMSAAPATLATQMKQDSSCSCHASCSEECPSTNACNIPCHTCAAMKIQPCPHGTKMPDPGDLGTLDPDCPWTLLSLCATTYIPNHWIVIKSPCIIISERGILYDCFL